MKKDKVVTDKDGRSIGLQTAVRLKMRTKTASFIREGGSIELPIGLLKYQNRVGKINGLDFENNQARVDFGEAAGWIEGDDLEKTDGG